MKYCNQIQHRLERQEKKQQIMQVEILNVKKIFFSQLHFNGLDWSLLVKHLEIGDIHNSWLYCYTNTFELGTRVLLSHCPTTHMGDETKAKHVSQVQEE